MADQEDGAVSILRRIEPALIDLARKVRDLRREVDDIHGEIKDIRKDIVDIKVAVATKPGRGEPWGAMAVMVALFALSLGGLAVVLPMLGHAR